MSNALDLLRNGDPESALQALQDQVRADPADAKHRVFLFQLLSVLGIWDRALTQLNVAGDLDASTLGMVQVYRAALSSEALRTQVFAGKRTPLIFGDPEQWLALLIEALRVGATGDAAKAAELRGEAFEQAPATAGRIDDEAFEWLADGDMRLGPVFEVIMNGQYYWVPVHRIAEVNLEEPEDLRDLIWMPAEFKWANGGEAVGLIPARYVGSDQSEDPMIRVGRMTEWLDQGADTFFGIGRRELATDLGEHSLLDVRSIVLDTVADGSRTT